MEEPERVSKIWLAICTLVPRRYEADDALGGWVYKQRRYQAGLTEKQRIQLESIGFDFETQDEKFESEWHERFQILKAHHAVGNYFINRDDFRSVNRDFQHWVKQQRRLYKQGKINEDHLQNLNSIGFCWESRTQKINSPTVPNTTKGKEEKKTWIQFYFSLVDFKNTHGHLEVPDSLDPDLATWVAAQKGRKADLSEHHRKLMEDINFEFDGDMPSLVGSSALLAAAIAWNPEIRSKRKPPLQPGSKRSKG